MSTGPASTGPVASASTGRASTDAAPQGLGWQRLHPVSPALRSWKVLAFLVVLYGQERGRALFLDEGPRPGLLEVLLAGGAVVVVVVIASALGVASWWMSRYLVDDAVVRLHSGVLFRQQRSAQLDRVQAVDVVRPLLARLLGFAEVRVEVAGGAGSGIRLAYLRRAEAERLQASILERTAQASGLAAGALAPTPGAAPDGASSTGSALDPSAPPAAAAPSAPVVVAAAPPVLTVPLGRLIGSIALGTAPILLVLLLAGVLVVGMLTGEPLSFFGVGPVLLGLAGSVWNDLTRGGSWEVRSTPDGVQLRYGLLERRTQTIPRDRVQAVRVSQPPLWRLTDWWRVEVNVAGYSDEVPGQAASSSRAVPVCPRADVDLLLRLVLPPDVAVGVLDPPLDASGATGTAGAVAQGLTGRTAEDGGRAGAWRTSPRRARVLDPVGWRRQGLLVLPTALLMRRGRLWRVLDVVPHDRTQSLGLVQGPWQRRLRLATLVVHSTPGPVRPVTAHLDSAGADEEVLAQADRYLRATAHDADAAGAPAGEPLTVSGGPPPRP